MTVRKDNEGWLDGVPIEIDTLSALVEGDLDAAQAEAVRERLLEVDPDLAHRVELMCQDRVMLRALGDERPPQGLTDSVVARLEREALLGLADGETTGGAIARSRVLTHQAGRRVGARLWLTSPAGAGLALAAVVALAIGITLQVLPGRSPMPVVPKGVGPIAQGDAAAAEQQRGPESLAARATAAEAPDAPPPELAIAKADPPTAAPGETFRDDWDKALTLLSEGRLLVRVQSVEPGATSDKLGRYVARADRPGESWRLAADVTEPVAIALEHRFAPTVLEAGPTIYADETSGEAPSLLSMRPRPRVSPLEAVYMADTRADTAALRSLAAALSLGDGQVAVFEELPEPIELPQVLTSDAVLWWGRPASEWVERRFVPVVIERAEQ